MPANIARAILAALLITPAATSAAPTANEQRVAVLNWGLAQTLLGLNVDPVAVANMPGYKKWVAHPPLPDSTVDVGRRIAPNMDVLIGVSPDLILTSGYYNQALDTLNTIAPIVKPRIYKPGTNALHQAFDVARELADRLNRYSALRAMRGRFKRAMTELRTHADDGDSVYVIRFRDSGHVQVFGEGSLFSGVLERAGLVNAWRGASNYWGFAMVPVQQLDRRADHLVVIEPIKRAPEDMMRHSAIWQALPAVRQGKVYRLPPIWSFGGVPSATRFADHLTAALDDNG